MKSDLLLTKDGPQKKISKPLPKKKENLNFDNEICLIIFLYENFADVIKDSAKSFENFITNTKSEKLSDLKEIINSLLMCFKAQQVQEKH